MKIKCISTKSSETIGALHYNFITIGKIYETLEISDYYYNIIEELREQKLKQLGI